MVILRTTSQKGPESLLQEAVAQAEFGFGQQSTFGHVKTTRLRTGKPAWGQIWGKLRPAPRAASLMKRSGLPHIVQGKK